VQIQNDALNSEVSHKQHEVALTEQYYTNHKFYVFTVMRNNKNSSTFLSTYTNYI